MLTGEPGIGKTRLAEELVARGRAGGARAAWATAWQGDGAPPLWPWVQILRELAGSDQTLGDFVVGSRGASSAAVFAQFEAVADVIRGVASSGPLVVVIEDLQWVDAASIGVLSFVAARTRDVGCLLVGTYRQGELDREHVAELARAGTTVAVPRLSAAAAAELLRTAAGPGVSDSAVGAVVQRSAGNPLFVWEFGQLMAHSGRLDVAPAAVPDAVAVVVERRLARLPEDVVAVLRMAAVAGTSFSGELVASIGEVAVDDVVAALAAAAGAGLATRTGRERFAFSHDVVHEVVLQGINPTRLAELHGRAAAVLASRLHTDPSFHAVVADHLDQAGPGHAGAASVEWELAARRAQDVLAYREAAAFLRRGAAAASADLLRRATLTLEEGESLLLAGDLVGARERFTACADLGVRIGAPEVRARAVLGIGAGPVAWEVPIASAEQAALVADALEALPGEAVALRSMLLARLSVTAATPETMETARQRARAALELAEQVGDQVLIAQALAAMNDAHAGPAHTMLRRENADAIVELALAAGDPVLELLGYRFRVVADLEVGDLAAVDHTITAFSRLAERLRQPLVSWYVPLFRGMRALLAGDLGAAERHQRRVAEAAEATGSENAEMLAITLLLGIQVADRRRPDHDAMEGLFDVDPADWASYASGLAMASWHAGNTARARELLKLHADNRFARLGDDGEHLTTILLFGRVAVGLGELGAASDLYDLFLPHRGLWVVDGIAACCWGPVDLELARIALALARVADARGHLERARLMVQRAQAPLLLRDLIALEQRCAQLEAAPTGADEDHVGPATSVFRREGQFWTLSYRGRTIRMKDAKGLHDLARLLAQPDQEVHVLDLIAAPGRVPAGRGGDLGELLDARARAEYRRRLAELESELAEAESHADLTRAERARDERAFIAGELSAALGVGGRPRRSGDPVERARKAVTGRIRLTIGRIDGEHAELARHLANSVQTGTYCVYRPEGAVGWSV